MRSALVIAALVCAASAARAEETRESRYGPTALRPSVSLAGSNYGGPVLGWAGKRDIAAPQAQAPARAPAPDLRPMATPWRQLGAIQQPRQQQPAQQAYAAPRPMQAPAPMAPPQFPQATAPAAATYPQPQVQAPATYAPPQFPSQLAGQTQGARTYSVGRQYGMTPDAIPHAPPNGMVFIAPSDEPRPSKKDEEPRHGSVEWLAQAPMDPPESDTAKSDSH
jgi:hypothetical protein